MGLKYFPTLPILKGPGGFARDRPARSLPAPHWSGRLPIRLGKVIDHHLRVRSAHTPRHLIGNLTPVFEKLMIIGWLFFGRVMLRRRGPSMFRHSGVLHEAGQIVNPDGDDRDFGVLVEEVSMFQPSLWRPPG